jgi:hypothetical protein
VCFSPALGEFAESEALSPKPTLITLQVPYEENKLITKRMEQAEVRDFALLHQLALSSALQSEATERKKENERNVNRSSRSSESPTGSIGADRNA